MPRTCRGEFRLEVDQCDECAIDAAPGAH